MSKKIIIALLATLVLASVHLAQAQQAKAYQVGVIYEGGPLSLAIDGLKDGLRELGYETGKHYILEIRDLKGDRGRPRKQEEVWSKRRSTSSTRYLHPSWSW
jgi:ABC-type uncharacterized transport system substrate-binding protein